MAVRDALLGLLTLGPAYGLQLHAELGTRAPHRAKTNVGQVYGTLDRLSTAGLVSHQGLTDDGLPLYALTEAGKSEALSWLSGDSLTALPEWADVQDAVLISSSVDAESSRTLIRKLEVFLNNESADADRSAAELLSAQASLRYRESVRNWLEDVAKAAIMPQTSYTLGRPKRGRPSKT